MSIAVHISGEPWERSPYRSAPIPAKRAALRGYETAERDRLAQDLITQRPDLILAQDQTGVFDWLAWARQDPVISHFLDGYVQEEIVPWGASTITILRRRPEGPPA